MNKEGIVSNGNYLWIQYFYSYLNATGKAGFVMAASTPDADGREQAIREKLLATGHVRGYFHVVDTTHNDWTPWQIKNISAIRWLWRGEKEKYAALLGEYASAIAAAEATAAAAGDAAALRQQAADAEEAKAKGWRQEKKELLRKAEKAEALAKEAAEIAASREWLVSKFGEAGECRDVPGLCKSATRAEIAEKKFSLNPGAYVGVPPQEDDGVDFTARLKEIHAELLSRQEELASLMKAIDGDLKELGL